MRTWSIESAFIRAYTTAAVAAQRVIDVFTHRPGYANDHPIPGCANASDCREYGCGGDCSEALEADERLAAEVEDAEATDPPDGCTCPSWASWGNPSWPHRNDCPTNFAGAAAQPNPAKSGLTAQQLAVLEDALGELPIGPPPPTEPALSDDELVGVRGLLQERYCPDCALSNSPAVSATGAGTSPAGVECLTPPEDPPAGFPLTTHHKWESCGCGGHLSCEGDEEAVLLACRNFRLYHHSHKAPQ